MVVIFKENPSILNLGVIGERNTGSKLGPLIIESLVAAIVALSNLLLIVIFIAGWRRIFKHHFYIVVANLIVFTSTKAFVELAFIIPYYVKRRERINRAFGYFTSQYELAIFNLSVLADYDKRLCGMNRRFLHYATPTLIPGVLFFSFQIAIDRYYSVKLQTDTRRPVHPTSKRKALVTCGLLWLCTLTIPLAMFFCDCQFVYNRDLAEYYNQCFNGSSLAVIIVNSLVYLSYIVTIIVLAVYVRIYLLVKNPKNNHAERPQSPRAVSAHLEMLKQSAFIFVLYAASIACVFALTFLNKSMDLFSDILYAENLLNLSIAAVYPICLLSMSGKMQRIIVAKVAPRPPTRVGSVSVLNTMAPVARADILFS